MVAVAPAMADQTAGYARHSRWSDPGTYGGLLDALPAAPAALPRLVGGLILHPLFAPAGTDTTEAALRGIAEIVAAVLARDPRPLDQARGPESRVIALCRSHALLACAILRQHLVPARLRVGFADYFTPEFWEDHWVCEYRDGGAWRLLDAELTADVCRRLGIAFDPADVPRGRFVAAGPAWQALRRGDHDAARVGVSGLGLAGMWFAAGSLLRDLAALTMAETLPWDYWGPTREFRPGAPVPAAWLGRLDRLADALAGEPASPAAAKAIVATHSWARLTPTVLAFPDGNPVEVRIGE